MDQKELNKDFIGYVPKYLVKELAEIEYRYSGEYWFEDAWNQYRHHILTVDRPRIINPNKFFERFLPNSEPVEKAETIAEPKVEEIEKPKIVVVVKADDAEEIEEEKHEEIVEEKKQVVQSVRNNPNYRNGERKNDYNNRYSNYYRKPQGNK